MFPVIISESVLDKCRTSSEGRSSHEIDGFYLSDAERDQTESAVCACITLHMKSSSVAVMAG